MNYTDYQNVDRDKYSVFTSYVPAKTYRKDDAAFSEKSGICYTDKDGKCYTYQDLMDLAGSEKAVKDLYHDLREETMEKSLEESRHFVKCDRCGNWLYQEHLFSLKRKEPLICPFCVPVKTRGVVRLQNDPYGDDRNFFHKRTALFRPGVTTLIGCNGIGKSTLLKHIEAELFEKGVPCCLFDNMSREGGGSIASTLLQRVLAPFSQPESSLEYAAGLFMASEGERIRESMYLFADSVLHKFDAYKDYGEYWILFDGIDSGLSLDVLEDVKRYLFPALMKKIPDGKDVYIICSSNSYELSEDTDMFAVDRMKYVFIRSYDGYKKAVHMSRERKAKRDLVFVVKSEIAKRPYQWTVDEPAVERYESCKEIDTDLFTMTLGSYRMTLHVKGERHDHAVTKVLQKTVDGAASNVSCKDFEGVDLWHICPERVEKEMHEYLCHKVFLDEKKRM